MINEATQLKPKNLGGLAVRTFSSAADYVELEKSVRGVVSGEIKLTQEEFADIQAGFCNAFLGLSSQFDQSVQGDFRVKLEEKSAQIHAWASDLIDVVEGRINQKIDGPARFLRASLFGFDPLMDWSEPGGKNDDHPKFSAFNCAQDILRKLKGRLFTEYTGAMHPYVEDRYLQDGENWLRSLIQYNLNVTEIPAEPAEISAVITILSNSTRVVDPGKIELPPAEILKLPKGWLPVVNGLLDTTSKTLVDFSPDYYYTSTIPRHYIPGAKSSVFRDFLDIVFGGDSEKDRKILAVYETAAWTLTSDYTIPGFMTWIGTGGEGKGTIADVFTHMLGEANVESIGIKELEGEKYKRAKLAGKRLNLVNESGDSVPGEMCKKLTDNSIVTVEIKNGHPFKMRNNAKFLQMTNILPDARDKSRAFFRRNKNLVEFPNLLEDSINVPQIVEFVKRMNDPAELDALFSEVVDDYLSSLVDRGRFANEPTMEEAAINYERVANPSAAYIKHQASNGLIFVDLEDASIYAKKHNIPEFAYIKEEKTGKSLISLKKIVTKDARKWAQGEGLPVDSIDAKKIGAALEYLDFPNFATEKRVGKARPQAWTGVFIAPIYSESLRAFETLTTKSPNDKQKVVNDFERSDDELNDDMDNKNTLHAHAGMEKNQYRRKNDQSDTGSTSNLPGYPPGRSHGESTENKEIEDPSPAGTSSTPQITEEKCAGVEKNPFRHNPGIILENPVNTDVSNTKPPNTITNELNQSYLMEKTVIDTIKKIMSVNKNSKIGTAEILSNWINGVDKPSFKELDEKIIPTMAASGLLSIHNETVKLTGNPMSGTPPAHHPPDISSLTHLSILEDIPEFSWTDGDWKLRKNDDAYVPSELAKTLISRGWAREIPKPSDKETITDSTASNSSEDNKQEEPKNPTPITTEPITKEQGDKVVQVLHERGIHLNGADTGVSVYGDKYNIAVPVNFYRQNAERVDQIMNELGFSKGNTGQLHNVFFDRSLKGVETQ